MYEFIDPTTLTATELSERILKANKMLMAYHQTGHLEMIKSLESLLGVLGEESEYRMLKKIEETKKEELAIEKQSSKYSRKKKTKKKEPNPNIVITLGYIKGVDD
jgi:hypothetical protein